MCTHMHTHTHVHTHACTHAHMHMCAHTGTEARVPLSSQSNSNFPWKPPKPALTTREFTLDDVGFPGLSFSAKLGVIT